MLKSMDACPTCAAEVDRDALRCRRCGMPFRGPAAIEPLTVDVEVTSDGVAFSVALERDDDERG